MRSQSLSRDNVTMIKLASCTPELVNYLEYTAIQIHRSANHPLQNELLMPAIEAPRIPYHSFVQTLTINLLGGIFHKIESDNKGYFEFRITRSGKREVKKFKYSPSGRTREQAEKEAQEYQRNYGLQ